MSYPQVDQRSMTPNTPDLKAKDDYGHHLGYNYFGPLLFNFTLWLIEQADKHHIHKLYFQARQGWLFKVVFDIITEHFPTHIKSYYMYSSRRSVCFTGITEKTSDADFLEAITKDINHMSLGKCLKRLGLNPNDHIKAIHDHHFKELDRPIVSPTDFQNIKNLLLSLKPEILKNFTEERHAFTEYLKTMGVLDLPRSAIVDVGWEGSVQHHINNIIHTQDPEMKLFGFYLSLISRAKRYYKKNTIAFGYLFNFADGKRTSAKIFFDNINIVESILTTHPHSVFKIAMENGEPKPVFDTNNDTDSIHPNILKIQDGMLDYARATCECLPALTTHSPEPTPFYKLIQLLKKPTSEFAEYLGHSLHNMDVGHCRESRPLAEVKPPAYYYAHPINFIQDYRKAIWRLGFYVQLPFFLKRIIDVFNILHVEKTYQGIKRFLIFLRETLSRS